MAKKPNVNQLKKSEAKAEKSGNLKKEYALEKQITKATGKPYKGKK